MRFYTGIALASLACSVAALVPRRVGTGICNSAMQNIACSNQDENRCAGDGNKICICATRGGPSNTPLWLNSAWGPDCPVCDGKARGAVVPPRCDGGNGGARPVQTFTPQPGPTAIAGPAPIAASSTTRPAPIAGAASSRPITRPGQGATVVSTGADGVPTTLSVSPTGTVSTVDSGSASGRYVLSAAALIGAALAAVCVL